MNRVEEIQKRLDTIDSQCDTIWNEFMDKSTEGIPYDIAYQWYKNQSIIQERKRLEQELRKIKEAYGNKRFAYCL